MQGLAWERAGYTLSMVAGSDSYYAGMVGLGGIDILAVDAEDAVAAIQEVRTPVVGKRTPPSFFIGNTVRSIWLIVRKSVQGKEYADHNKS